MAITYFGAASSPADNASQDDTAARSLTPPASMQDGDLAYAVAVWHHPSATRTINQTNAGGQTWFPLTLHQSTSSQICRAYWCRFDGTWSANPAWQTSNSTTSGFTLYMLVYRPTETTYTWAVDVAEAAVAYAAPGSPFDVAITGQSPTASASVVTIAIWASTDNNTWALQSPGSWANPGGTTQIRNTAVGDDGSVSAAYLIQTSAGATGDITNRQTVNGGDAGWTLITTFREDAPASTLVWPQHHSQQPHSPLIRM